MPPFSHYYKRFSDRIDGAELKDYWEIQIKPNETLDIGYSPYIINDISNSHSIEFHIEYSKTYSLDFIGLPREISDMINEYARDMVEIRTWIHYPENYPFRHPTWEYVLVNHNTYFNMEKKIKENIDRLNCNYRIYWSPVARIDVQFHELFIEIYNSNSITNSN